MAADVSSLNDDTKWKIIEVRVSEVTQNLFRNTNDSK